MNRRCTKQLGYNLKRRSPQTQGNEARKQAVMFQPQVTHQADVMWTSTTSRSDMSVLETRSSGSNRSPSKSSEMALPSATWNVFLHALIILEKGVV